MKTILICPDHPAAGAAFRDMKPLALLPVLGRPLIEWHLLNLAAAGVKQVIVLASDRPAMIRKAVGNGAAWGLDVEVTPSRLELTSGDALILHGGRERCTVRVLEGLPHGLPLWQSYAGTFNEITARLNNPASTELLTMREVKPQVWISTKAKVADGVIIDGPVWIGPHAVVASGVVIGPRTIIESHAFVDQFAALSEVWVGPSTYVGVAASLERAFVWGKTVTHWMDGSTLQITDTFVLDDLAARRMKRVPLLERIGALLLLMLMLPFAGALMLRSWLKGRPAVTWRIVEGLAGGSNPSLGELVGATGFLRRWPELWEVVKGRLFLVGNRPLTPEEAGSLRGEIGQLWFSVPCGVLSLADVENGFDAATVAENIAHAAVFAGSRSLRLRCSILLRCLLGPRSATVHPQPVACS